MQLYNKLSADERSKILESTNLKRITLSFYQYAKITDPKKFRDSLFIFWDSIGVLGRIYVQQARGEDKFKHHKHTKRPLKLMTANNIKIRKKANKELYKIFYSGSKQKGKY